LVRSTPSGASGAALGDRGRDKDSTVNPRFATQVA
jgi:hypothetical protein